MNIVIAGAGQVGYFLAKALMDDNEVTIIDRDEEKIDTIESTLDVLCILGDVENPHTYRDIHKDIDIFIAVTDSDEVNILSCVIIDNSSTVKEKIVRLKNNLFINENIKNKLGISTMISPALNVAKNFNYLADFPHVNNIKAFDNTKAFLLSVRAHKDFQPQLISTFIAKFENKIVVAGIEREEKFFIPNESDMFISNDLIYFFAFPSVINSIRENICNKPDKQIMKNCIIYGANHLGIEIATVLANKNLNIKVIDKDMKNCWHANMILKNHAEVIKSNYDLDSDLEASSGDVNVFIASTMNDEFNIIKCIEAKQKGIEKVIGIYNNSKYATLMRKLGIEVIRGEKMSAYNSILENVYSSTHIKQKAFCGEEGRISVKQILSNSRFINKKPSLNAKLFKKANFYIQRDKRFILYENIDKLLEDDIVIQFSHKKDSKPLTQWFK